MRLNADSYFCIGQAHAAAGDPCQDYALAACWDSLDFAQAIISDGCSTGGDTDVGARIVARTWKYGGSLCGYETLGIDQNDMLATLGAISVDADEGDIKTHLFGDGVFAFKAGADDLFMAKYEWANNTPFYPAYAEFDDMERFRAAHAGSANPITEEAWYWDGETFTPHCPVNWLDIDDALEGLPRSFPIERSGTFAVFTDGITQINGVDWKSAVVEAMAHKNFAGRFVARRMMAMLKDKTPIDDIACAAVRVDLDG